MFSPKTLNLKLFKHLTRLQSCRSLQTSSLDQSLPNVVRIVEVGPRDGLQNEKSNVDTDVKVKFISKLVSAGQFSNVQCQFDNLTRTINLAINANKPWGSRFVSTWSRSRSRSRRQKSISLDGRENLDSFKKLVSTIEKSRSRSRYLDFVSTSPSRSKYLDRDLDLSRFTKNLDNFSISIEK